MVLSVVELVLRSFYETMITHDGADEWIQCMGHSPVFAVRINLIPRNDHMSHAIITGAGSGVGQAIAVALARRGWNISLIGRRPDGIEATQARVKGHGVQVNGYLLDIAHIDSIRQAVCDAIAKNGGVQALVNSAGTNVPRRSFNELRDDDWRAVLDTNLHGVFNLVSSVLPDMRKQGRGTIVNIVSDAGLRANAKAGPSYVASKFAVSGLTQAINCEEQKNGIRATAIYPGDINTPLLDKRPVPPPPEARLTMLQPEDVAACAVLAIELPSNAVLEELLIRPRSLT